MIGTRIGQYLIESRLGAGGMGVVYRAFDTRLERPVAIKLFADLSDTKAHRRLLHEARSASALNHPHVCTIYEVAESGDTLYLVMEYVEGRPLNRVIPSAGLPVETVTLYGAQIASALAHAHARGVIHRDLKSLNVVVTPEHQAKVLDFGLALREMRAEPESETVFRSRDSLETAGAVSGTLLYMAPEALLGQAVDRRADIWALGVVLYEMASGTLPFAGQTEFEISGRILHAPPTPLPARVPAALASIVERCLAKEPARRFQDAADVRAALEAITPAAASASSGTVSLRDAAGERRGLLVLPFTNVATDADTDYFADGLSEEIIADLSNLQGLRVISSTSSMRLKGTTRTVEDLARHMHVEYVLEGSVRRSGAAVRITAKLIEAATDSPVWGDKYSGTLDDVFAIQEKLSRAIVQALRVALTPDESARLRQRPIADVRAYEWYLRARQELLKFTGDGLERAIECLAKATAIAGENVLLLAATGEAYWQYVNAGISADQSYLDRADACARRVIELDPASPHGHRIAGLVRVHRGDLPAALRQLRQALDREPDDPDALLWGCIVAALSGQMTLAHAWAARLVEVDPVTPFSQLMPASMAWLSGDYERAATEFAQRYTAVLETPLTRFIYGQILVAAGRPVDGLRELDALARAMPDNPFGQLAAAFRPALAGDREKVATLLSPSLLATLEGDPQYCWFLAQCYALAGEVDAGIRWVETAVSRGFFNHALLSTRDPFLENLRGDPRYPAVVADAERRMRALEH